MTADLRSLVRHRVHQRSEVRLKRVVRAIGWPCSSFFRQPAIARRRPGPAPRPLPPELVATVRRFAKRYPWWGYKRLAVVLRRNGVSVSNRLVYRVLKQEGLLIKQRTRNAELYQAAKLFELLPKQPNDLWQADVTYIHIPGFGWWYAVTVIDYFSRYLLALHLSSSNDAQALMTALDAARAEAEKIHGPPKKPPILVTDNGSNFLAKRFRKHIQGHLTQVRTRYRTPQQLGLLERFHATLKAEEVHWDLYDSPEHARRRLKVFRRRYNQVRPHWALRPCAGGDPVTPKQVYKPNGVDVGIPAWQPWAKAAKKKLDQLMQEERNPARVVA